MKKRPRLNNPHSSTPLHRDFPSVAIFWDQSLVWGLICLETLERLGVPYRLLSGEDIARGALKRHRILLVPGGWASHKVRALGEGGSAQVRRFIEEGGAYLGFCGGAGLALSSPPALNLVPIRRMPLSKRVPSASGEVWIQGTSGHPAWRDLPLHIPVSVWWPSQFDVQPLGGIRSLASYSATGKDFWVADLPLADLESGSLSLAEWERTYGINLDPARMLGHPAILEAGLGKGVLILSYPHLETPDEFWGNRLFLNILGYLDSISDGEPAEEAAGDDEAQAAKPPPTQKSLRLLNRSLDRVEGLIRFGERHLLWNWRNSWLLSWRRGIRGLEYGSLVVALRCLSSRFQKMTCESSAPDPWLLPLGELEAHTAEFCSKAKLLLLEEKLSAQSGNLTKLGSVNEKVDELRACLFGDQMNHGGLSRVLLDELDALLLHALRHPRDPAGLRLKAAQAVQAFPFARGFTDPRT